MSSDLTRRVKKRRSTGTAVNDVRPTPGTADSAGTLVESGDLVSAQEWVLFAERYALSNRELSIAALLCDNLPRKLAATKLGISLNTVHRYCDRLHKKLGVEDAVGVVLKVWRFLHGARQGCAMGAPRRHR